MSNQQPPTQGPPPQGPPPGQWGPPPQGPPPQGPPPGQWGPPPGPPPGQGGGQWGPPPGPPPGQGGWGAPTGGPSGGGPGKGVIIGIVAAAVLLLGGGTAAAVMLTGGDDDKDRSKGKDEETSETVSLEDWCADLEDIDDDTPQEFADGLEEIGVPEELDGDAAEGREKMIEVAREADEDSSYADVYDEQDDETKELLDAFTEFVEEECESGSGSGTESSAPSESPTDAGPSPSAPETTDMGGIGSLEDTDFCKQVDQAAREKYTEFPAFIEALKGVELPDEAPADASDGYDAYVETGGDFESWAEWYRSLETDERIASSRFDIWVIRVC